MLPELCCDLLHFYSNLRPRCLIWIIPWNLSALAASFLIQTLPLCNLHFFGLFWRRLGTFWPEKASAITKKNQTKKKRETDLWSIPAKTVLVGNNWWSVGELFPLCCKNAVMTAHHEKKNSWDDGMPTCQRFAKLVEPLDRPCDILVFYLKSKNILSRSVIHTWDTHHQSAVELMTSIL